MKQKTIESLTVLFIIVIFLFALYGAIQLCTRTGRIAERNAQVEKINQLELTIEEYERINETLPVLRQLLTPLALAELDTLSEQLLQENIAVD